MGSGSALKSKYKMISAWISVIRFHWDSFITQIPPGTIKQNIKRYLF